jgi:hypothetical protein
MDGDLAEYNPYNLGGDYWSSTQHDNNSAVCYWVANFSNRGPGLHDKNATIQVIAIRAF